MTAELNHGARCSDNVGEAFRVRRAACDAAAEEQAREASSAGSQALQPPA